MKKWFKRWSPILTFSVCIFSVVMVVVATLVIAWDSDVKSNRVIAELGEEVKVYGVKSFVMHARMYNSKNLPYAVLFIVENRADFLQKIQLYQPKIIYYYKASVMTYISFSFYEDEAEKQILYRWICDWER